MATIVSCPNLLAAQMLQAKFLCDVSICTLSFAGFYNWFTQNKTKLWIVGHDNQLKYFLEDQFKFRFGSSENDIVEQDTIDFSQELVLVTRKGEEYAYILYKPLPKK